MTTLNTGRKGEKMLLMGNEAIARGALEAGVNVVTGYPGTPSSEIIDRLSKADRERNLYVEWSVNEKVATEVAAAGSFAGLRSMAVMKMMGVNVASDFLMHLVMTGTRGGLVLVSAEDPGAISSLTEGESRYYSKFLEFPLLEPGGFQEAKDMTKWAFELSEKINNIVMLRTVTRISHGSGNVVLGELPETSPRAHFEFNGTILDEQTGPILTVPGPFAVNLHARQQNKLQAAANLFEDCPFNTYEGPENPELLIITSSVCHLYCIEAVELVDAPDRVGILKLGTTWPLPAKFLKKHMQRTERILIIEEVLPFLEENIQVLACQLGAEFAAKKFHGKGDGTMDKVGELNPTLVAGALSRVLDLAMETVSVDYSENINKQAVDNAPDRMLTFCPGCPHRASFWSIKRVLELNNQQGFVCGDIGCYGMGMLPCGFETVKTVHSMGSGTGLASGFGKLGQFGMDQKVLSVCGDSTFFHTVMPALANAIHHRADITLVVLDNSGTAMTGFQPHPGLTIKASGTELPALDIPSICRAMGAKVQVVNPFDVENAEKVLLKTIEDPDGVKVVVMRQICALSPEKKSKKQFEIQVDENVCIGEECGCNRLCTRVFKCPGLVWDGEKKTSKIDAVLCVGCGVCHSICPSGAIQRKEIA
ncbi:indolepyruvate ferredoxin oxidoreductase alpha subunit [Desulfocicer vacuolatum DSM 3385]|uniref:Indolepyruvate oxidoreductase subunit IorA n=2 Tax=Desulfocicer vacuolatum TaxID=2298 RepID=A0A1W2EQ43_9BACT|nr:indolepyruvate ferredoxin oxidoreductase alpha subunit [Desulfocicer vacuolatum DSM 3385]